MRLLLANLDLSRYGGTQLFAADLARKLVAWGHEPILYSPVLGAVARDVRAWAVPVTSDLRTITAPPDVIIGNHHLATMTALQQFPACPAIYVCHDIHTYVPKSPRILRYVAVDQTCRSRLIYECGIEPRQVEVILNSVDLTRFVARDALPPKPRRALLFGNQFAGNGPWQAIREACKREGIETDVVGLGAESTAEPERVLLQYDLVFARARSALEAMATGAATILAGPNRMGALVTAENLDHFRPLNFGRRAFTTPIDVDAVRREIARYEPADAAAVCRTIRATASLDLAAAEMLRVADEVIDEQRERPADIAADYAATAFYLSTLATEPAQRMERLRMRIGSWPVVGPLARRIVKLLER